MSDNLTKLTIHFNLIKVSALLFLLSCGVGREESFDEFNTIDSYDMWLNSEERVKPPIYDDKYILGRKDAIKIKIQDHDEFSTRRIVDLNGEIYLPLIDEPLLIEGLTLEQAEESVCLFLSPFIKGNVNCKVELMASGSRFYYVMGDGVSTVRNIGNSGGGGDDDEEFQSSGGSIKKVPMGVEPIYLRELLLEHEDETNLEDITIIRPDFTDRRKPRFMSIDMSDISRAIWNKDYRIRPNDIIVVHKTFRERLKDLMGVFVTEVETADASDRQFESMLRFLEARLSNDSDKKSRHSGGR